MGRGGLKNLRCFPKCLTKGHNRNGFCGRPVKAELQISASAFTRSQFVAYGRFTLADSSDYDFDSIITQFETYEASDIMKQTKTKEDNSRPLYKSIPTTVSSSSSSSTGGGRGVIEFNFNPTSWHYGWRSSKHMKDSAHVFRIFVFVVSPDRNLLKCIGITETSWFTLASSKRAKQDETKLKKQQQLLQKGMHSQVPPSHVSNTNHPHQSSNAHLNLLASLSKHEQNTWTTNNNSSINHNNNTTNNLTRGVSFGSFSTNGMSSMMNQNHGQPLSNSGQTIHSLQGLQSLQSLHSFDGSHLNNAAYLNGMPNGTNNNKEMDIQAINQSREIQQQKAIQQLIDSGLVQSEKTKFTINQGAGAVPPANNANEKAAADAISSLSSSSSSTNYTSKEGEWVQCESCKKMAHGAQYHERRCALNTWNEAYNHCNKPQEKASAIITSSQNNNIDLIRANSINTLNNLNTMNNNSVNAISGLPVLGGLSYGNGLSSGLSSLNSIQNMMSNVNYSNNLSNISTLNSISGINNMTNNINGMNGINNHLNTMASINGITSMPSMSGMNGLHNLNGLHGLNSVNSFNNLPTGMTTTSFNDTSSSNNTNTTSSTSSSTTSSSSSSDAKNVSEGSTSGGGGGDDDLSDAKVQLQKLQQQIQQQQLQLLEQTKRNQY